MAKFTYPQNDFDKPNLLLSYTGSFWATTYQGNDQIESLLGASGQNAQQTYLKFIELLNSISRHHVPLYHRKNWFYLPIRESGLNTDPALIAKYKTPGEFNYVSPATITYGEVRGQTYWIVRAPTDMVDVGAIFNRVVMPSVSMVKGVDFKLEDGLLLFVTNPFDNPLIPVRKILDTSGNVVDRELTLWMYCGDWDYDYVFEQFGYVLGLQLRTSENYKKFINAIFDAFVEGTNVKAQQLALAAAFGIPITVETEETVVTIATDRNHLNIITDHHAYLFPIGSTPIVAVGDKVPAGSFLTDNIQILELNRGTVPDRELVPAYTFGPETLAAGYWGDITFSNESVPLVVEPNVDGYTKVSWQLGGAFFDVEKFWEDVHTRGVAAGKTLAMILDQRTEPVGQPFAACLPETINPLEFAVKNLLRNNTIIVKLTGRKTGAGLAFVPTAQLRKITPPQTLLVVILELTYADEPIVMENPGTAQQPGYQEAQSSFVCGVFAETLADSALVEQVRVKTIRGHCV